jgi:hypothetical protein
MHKFAIVVLMVVLNGCATVIGSDAEVTVKSIPEGAEVWLNGEIVGQAPVTFSVPNDSSPYLTIKHPGYKMKVVELEKGRNAATYGNVLLGPFYSVGEMVDTLSGHEGSIKDAVFTIELDKEVKRVH